MAKSYVEEERDALRAENTRLRKLLEAARDQPLRTENERLRNELNAALARETTLREALENVEWNGYHYVGSEPCPSCGNERVKGHAQACLVAAALAASDHRNHDGWQKNCPICEHEADEADKLLDRAERNKQ